MPRPRLDLGGTVRGGLSATAGPTTTNGAASARLLTSPRSRRYLDAIAKLDGSATLTPVQTAEIVDGIHREFAEKWSAFPAGIVSHCYLGPPFEAHTLSIDGSIIEHYRTGEPMPGLLQDARPLSRTDTYLAIEVYPGRLVCVGHDGAITIMGAS